MIKKLKKTAFTLALLTMLTTMSASIVTPVFAQDADKPKTEEPMKGSIGPDKIDTLHKVADPTKLPNFTFGQHAEAVVEPGVAEITSVGYFAIDAVKYIVGTIAFLFIIISAVKLVTAGKEVEDVTTKQKEHIKYSLFALVIVILADPLVKEVFFGYEGEVLTSESYAKEFAARGNEQIMGVVNFVEMLIASIAVLVIIGSGLAILVMGGNEETRTKHIKHIAYAVGGLILVGLSELIVKGIIFPDNGEALPDLTAGRLTILNLVNFVTGFIATLSVAMGVYAGYLYVLGAQNEENTQKAKKVIAGAAIGILLAFAAFAIANTLIPDNEEVPTAQPAAGEI